MREHIVNNEMRLLLYFLLICAATSSCSTTRHAFNSKNDYEVDLDTLRLYDEAREREIPIAVYQPVTKLPNEKIVIFSHGYGHNYQKNYLIYSYLTDELASKGYFVVSIQHELPTDSILPFTGIPQVVRLPFWERGVENILFVINSLKKTNPDLNFEHITLIGHSNGGDMTALFPQKYPNVVENIITLDHLRVTLPKTTDLKIFSLRSCDKEPDEGVLLDKEEQMKYDIKIVKLSKIKHNDMNDFGKRKSKTKIQNYVLEFLNQEEL